MKYSLGFGKTSQTVLIDDAYRVSVLEPESPRVEKGEQEILKDALAHPIGMESLTKFVHTGDKVCVITSDITRPMPSWKVLPLLLDTLNEAGIPDEDITVLFALGSHRGQTEEEMIHLVGEEVYQRVKCLDSDESRAVHVGDTSRGTPVDIDSVAVNADCRICLGTSNIITSRDTPAVPRHSFPVYPPKQPSSVITDS